MFHACTSLEISRKESSLVCDRHSRTICIDKTDVKDVTLLKCSSFVGNVVAFLLLF